MDLQILRTVIKNEVNEVSVCTDLKRDTGTFYTLISINDENVRREVVKKIKGEGAFSNNRDFIGSFTYENSFCLIFNYRNEVRLGDKEAMIAGTFKKRKELANAFVMACIEADCSQSMGELILEEANINIVGENKIQFNYFMDFAKYKPDKNERFYYDKVGKLVFEILAREYILKFDENIDNYPKELQAFFKKMQKSGFTSYNQILTFINLMPDKPVARERGIRRIWSNILAAVAWARAHSMQLFLGFLVVFTVIYTAYQITARLSVGRNMEENLNFSGLYTIGDVYLGDEDL